VQRTANLVDLLPWSNTRPVRQLVVIKGTRAEPKRVQNAVAVADIRHDTSMHNAKRPALPRKDQLLRCYFTPPAKHSRTACPLVSGMIAVARTARVIHSPAYAHAPRYV